MKKTRPMFSHILIVLFSSLSSLKVVSYRLGNGQAHTLSHTTPLHMCWGALKIKNQKTVANQLSKSALPRLKGEVECAGESQSGSELSPWQLTLWAQAETQNLCRSIQNAQRLWLNYFILFI